MVDSPKIRSPEIRLRLNGLARSFGEVAALEDFSLDVAAGEAVALLGGAGAGKSLVIALAAGVLRPSAGTVTAGGRVAAVFAEPGLFGHLSVERNVALAGGATGEMLELFRLGGMAARPGEALTAAEAALVALARALARKPAVLLLDDPFAWLEPGERRGLWGLLGAARGRLGVAMLFATRDAGEAMAVGDRAAVLVGGRLRQVGAARAIYEAPVDAAVARLLGEDNRLAGFVEEVEDDIARVRLACGPVVEAAAGELAAGRRCIVSIRPERIAVAATTAAEMGEGAIAATLREAVFQGDHVRLTVEIGSAGGDLVVVQRPATAPLGGLVPGADLALAWQPHHARAFRPEAGT